MAPSGGQGLRGHRRPADFQSKFDVHDTFVETNNAVDDFGKSFTGLSLKADNAKGHLTSIGKDGKIIFGALGKLGPQVGKDLAETFLMAQQAGKDTTKAVQDRATELREQLKPILLKAGVDPSELDNYFEQLVLDPPSIDVDLKAKRLKVDQDLVDTLLPIVQKDLDDHPALKAKFEADVARVTRRRKSRTSSLSFRAVPTTPRRRRSSPRSIPRRGPTSRTTSTP